MKRESSWSCIDLFSGAGGLSIGLKQAGWRPVFALDCDSAAAATYKANFPGIPFFEGDVRKIDFTQWKGKVRLVAGGPPCQPFSVAGSQRAQADIRDMIPEFVRAVREVEPEVFLMENVAGLTTSRHRIYLENVKATLQSLGYEVRQAVLNAADYGVPQKRMRLILVGARQEEFTFPRPTHGARGRRGYVTAEEQLHDVPQDEPNKAIVTYAKKPVLRPSPWAGMLVNGGGRPINLSGPSHTIPASAGGNRTHILDPNGILADYHSYLMDGGRPRSGKVKGVRRLTVRESARLQTFPDEFVFKGKRSAMYRQVGNAVPPTLAAAVAKVLRRQLS